jgi:hypothetical protein
MYDHLGPVELRDGHRYCGNVVVTASSTDDRGKSRLSEETRRGLGMTTRHARLSRCAGCGEFFIGHFSACLCSPECRATRKAKTVAKASAKRSERTLWWRARQDWIRCEYCEMYFNNYLRRSSRFCSNACRQAAYRARRAPSGRAPEGQHDGGDGRAAEA